MVNIEAKEMKKALRNTGWDVQPSQGDHVKCRKNGVTVDFEGNSNEDASRRAIQNVRSAVERADDTEFRGDGKFKEWVDENK